MAIEVKVPVLPESVSDATIATWHKQPGDAIRRDENLVDLETDKVVLEVPSPVDGVLKQVLEEHRRHRHQPGTDRADRGRGVAAAPAKRSRPPAAQPRQRRPAVAAQARACGERLRRFRRRVGASRKSTSSIRQPWPVPAAAARSPRKTWSTR